MDRGLLEFFDNFFSSICSLDQNSFGKSVSICVKFIDLFSKKAKTFF